MAVLVYSKALEELQYLRLTAPCRPLPIRRIKNKLTSDEVLHELGNIKSGSTVSFDIETLRRRFPYTISFATSPSDAIAFKLWGHDNGPRILREVNRVLSTCRLIGQNCTVFDCNWLGAAALNAAFPKSKM